MVEGVLSREILDGSQGWVELARLAVIWLQLGPGLPAGAPCALSQALSAGSFVPNC